MPTITAPKIWSDLDEAIKSDSRGAIKKVINVDAVVSSIHNILGTAQGERVMLPDFATKLGSMVFEPMNEELMGFMAREIRTVIEKWDDRVKVKQIQFLSDPDGNSVSALVVFRVKGHQGIFDTTVKV